MKALDRGGFLFGCLTLLLLPVGVWSDINLTTCSFSSPYISSENTPPIWDQCSPYYYGPDVHTIYAKLSEVSACISSFGLDTDNATQYLESIKNLTRDFYIFNDIAVDPLLSEPLTTLFDYTIYNETGHGKVDVQKELSMLEDEVRKNGATLDLFLKVNEIFAKLNDAHVTINGGLNTYGMLDNMIIVFISDEIANGAAEAVTVAIEFPSNEFKLVASMSQSDGSVQTKQVATIDGKSPLEFVTELAMKPLGGGLTFVKSLGPKMQLIMKGMFNPYLDPPFFGFFKLQGSTDSSMAGFLKDSYDVVYDDGTTAAWNVFQKVPCPVAANWTKEAIELNLTKPGALYTALTAAETLVAESPLLQRRLQSTESRGTRRVLQDTESSGVNFTRVPVHGEGEIGYYVGEDFAVLKVDVGFEYEENEMLSAWSALTDEANEKGVTKLIVDIIGNGGGIIELGYQLALLMYPNMTWEDVANPYDALYSEATDIYWNDVTGLFNDFFTYASNLTELQIATDFLNQDPDFLVPRLQSAIKGLEALSAIFTEQLVIPFDILKFQYIVDNVSQRKNTTLEVVELALMLQQLNAIYDMVNLSPGQFTFGGSVAPEPVEHIRGGIAGNYTTPFYYIDPTRFVRWKQEFGSELHHPYQFEQYLILADGNGVGSTTNTFQTTVTQFAKSNIGTVPPLDTVSFGGNGKKEDAAVTQFAGGSKQSADVAALYVPNLLLLVMAFLGAGSDIGQRAIDIGEKFYNAIPEPCYYCDSAPQLPVWEVYSLHTGPDSIPLEYTNQRPSFYIKQWPTRMSFSNTIADLPRLYDFTKEFFAEQAVTSAAGASAFEIDESSGDEQNVGGGNRLLQGGEGAPNSSAGSVLKVWLGGLLVFVVRKLW